MSVIRDPGLAGAGEEKIVWVEKHMPLLKALGEEYLEKLPFKGMRISICLHLEAKTALLCRILRRGGARVAVSGSNPLSTQDDVAAALAAGGVEVFAWHNASPAEYEDFLKCNLLDNKPHLIIDDGGDLAVLLHQDEMRDICRNVKGGAEETTTGLIRLRGMARRGTLKFPMVAVNDAFCKYLFDNRYGTGQSVWDGIMRTTNLLVAGKDVVVVGYGWCGKGVAQRARGLGARVTVTEVDPIRALEAMMEGYRVMPLLDAAPQGDFFITVTSSLNAINESHIRVMKEGAVLCNAGHFDREIDKKALARQAVRIRSIKKNIQEYRMKDGRSLYLLAEGRLVNLASGDGHPAEIMDLSFALQALSLEYLKNEGSTLSPRVLGVPYELDRKVAELKLSASGVRIDSLDERQARYLSGQDQEL